MSTKYITIKDPHLVKLRALTRFHAAKMLLRKERFEEETGYYFYGETGANFNPSTWGDPVAESRPRKLTERAHFWMMEHRINIPEKLLSFATDTKECDSLERINCKGIDLRYTKLNGRDLSRLDFSSAYFVGASAHSANLEETSLIGTDCRNMDITYARVNHGTLITENRVALFGNFGSTTEAKIFAELADVIGADTLLDTDPSKVNRLPAESR